MNNMANIKVVPINKIYRASPVDPNIQIYPKWMGEDYEKESIKDKSATCIRILKNINFILIETRWKIALL